MPAEFERQARGIDADALPGFHLALVALLGDLAVEADRRERVNDVGRKALLVDIDALVLQRGPIGIQPFAQRRHDADAGDPDFLWRWLHLATACSGKPILLAIASMCARKSGLGKGIRREGDCRALHFSFLADADLGLGHGIARAFVLELRLDRQELDRE